jgi:cyclic pyranopterin phosphate synthase
MIFNPQAKLLHHGSRVERWLALGRTIPVLFEVAPTGYCNAKCPWCLFNGKKYREKIRRDTMISAIDDMADLGVKALNWSGGGEPTLHPDFELFIEYASTKRLKQGLFTNGYNVIPRDHVFSWIRISLTERGYLPIKKPSVPFGIVLNQIPEHTDEQLTGLCKQAKAFGAYYFQIRPALVGSGEKQPVIRPPKFLEQYADKDFSVYVTEYKYREAIRPKDYTECYGYHFCPSIDWKGKLIVCLYASGNNKYTLGDLNKTRLLKLWPEIAKDIKVTEACQNCCKNHEINRALYAAMHTGSVDFL